MKKILYVDSCVNRETSRTERLAQALLERLDGPDVEIETLVLEDEKRLVPLTIMPSSITRSSLPLLTRSCSRLRIGTSPSLRCSRFTSSCFAPKE